MQERKGKFLRAPFTRTHLKEALCRLGLCPEGIISTILRKLFYALVWPACFHGLLEMKDMQMNSGAKTEGSLRLKDLGGSWTFFSKMQINSKEKVESLPDFPRIQVPLLYDHMNNMVSVWGK